MILAKLKTVWALASMYVALFFISAGSAAAHPGDHQNSNCRDREYYEDHIDLCPTLGPFDPFAVPEQSPPLGGGGGPGGIGGAAGWVVDQVGGLLGSVGLG